MQLTAEIQELLDKYLRDQMSQSELARFKNLLQDPTNKTQFADLIETVLKQQRYNETTALDKEQLFMQIMQNEQPLTASPVIGNDRVHFLKTAWFRYAAAIVLLLGVGAYLWTTNKTSEQPVARNHSSAPADILPGGNKAILSLADGTTIILDSAGNGTLAQQGNVSIIKLSNGEIVYKPKGAATADVLMNTMSTPKGGQYQLTLPDGSKVWLNAASSIVYPTAFSGAERKVKISGEAYFEVFSNKKQPFIVDIDGKSQVQVLGTSFNINSYTDENNIKATLLEGSVKVVASGQTSLLKPGQQAQINSDKIDVTADIEMDQVMAWKNGFFNFNGADLSAVLRQLERWYDINTKFEGKVPKMVFKGEMDRNVNLSDVLEFFTETGVRFRMEGKTLVIL